MNSRSIDPAVTKASGSPQELDLSSLTTNPNDIVSGCPVDLGGEEAWCVAIDQEVQTVEGLGFSHFIVQRHGDFWSAEALTPTEAYATFYLAGCSNWDSVQQVANR